MARHSFTFFFYAAVFAPPAAVTALVLGQSRFDPRLALVDPMIAASEADECCRSYFGFVSNLGVLYLAATASITLFAALLIGMRGEARREVTLLATAGLISGWLCIDDLFMVHEDFLPWVGVPQIVTYAVYGMLVGVYLFLGRRLLLEGDKVLLGVALALFGISIGIDIVYSSLRGPLFWVEDTAKFMGFAAWTGFHVLLAADLSMEKLATGRR